MAFVQTEDPRVARDCDSRGLSATNEAELKKHRVSRKMSKRLLDQQMEAEDKFKSMDDRLDRCESLLREMVTHMNSLMTRPCMLDGQE